MDSTPQRPIAGHLTRCLPLMGLALMGCLNNLAARSVGHMPCSEDEIEISADSGAFGNTRTWVATCRGRQYHCAIQHAGGGHKVTILQSACTPSDSPAQAATPTPVSKADPTAGPWRELGHDGVRFAIPSTWERDLSAKGEIYRDDDNHYAVRLRIVPSSASASEWLATEYAGADIQEQQIGDRMLPIATKTGKKLRVLAVAAAVDGKLYELACTSDDIASPKAPKVCVRVLLSFRVDAKASATM